MTRRQWLAAVPALATAARAQQQGAVPDYERPLWDLRKQVPAPVKIRSIELLQVGSNYFVRSTSEDGAVGICLTKQVSDFIPILLRRVVPHFLGKDARDLETLVDEVYVAESNYKMAGLAFWAPVAYVEQSLFDLLGKTSGKPVGALLGGVIRKRIPVYLSGAERGTKAEEEVDIYVRGVEMTGARAVKFKIGGRMSRNLDAYPGRSETMMALARKRLGDAVTIYVDANGSYDARKGIEVGRMLEELNVGFFEEPCPFEELGETKKVADALRMPVAGGEQDSSLWRFQWMADNRVVDILQPDINYNGGFVRTCRVARIARAAGMPITPHNTQTGAASVNILQFASAVPNVGPWMEFPFRARESSDSWYAPQFQIRGGEIAVPQTPGLGVDFDPDYMKRAELVRL